MDSESCRESIGQLSLRSPLLKPKKPGTVRPRSRGPNMQGDKTQMVIMAARPADAGRLAGVQLEADGLENRFEVAFEVDL